jgi:hypothetical protein
MREACKFNVQIHIGNILMSSVTKDRGVSSILLFSGSCINFPRPLYKGAVTSQGIRNQNKTASIRQEVATSQGVHNKQRR